MKRSWWNEIKCGPCDPVCLHDDDGGGSSSSFSDGSSSGGPSQSYLVDRQSVLSVPFEFFGRRFHDVQDDARELSGGAPANAVGQRESPEALLARDLTKLSLDERENVFEDIHGVRPETRESKQFLDRSLDLLERELGKLGKECAWYNRALFLNRKYVKSRDFEVMFLRSDQYDPAKAAKRLALHFDKKYELFGHGPLARDIRYSDLDQDAVDSLHEGMCCLYPTNTDSVGRAIHFVSYKPRAKDIFAKRHMQAGWYLFMKTMTKNVVAQKRGMIVVIYAHKATGKEFLESLKLFAASPWMSTATACRISAIHFCSETTMFRSLLSSTVKAIPSHMRPHSKIHYGSMLECQYALSSFGVTMDKMPMDSNADLRYDFIAEQIRKLRLEDEEWEHQQELLRGAKPPPIDVQEADVLLGKGPSVQWFPGNVAMLDIIRQRSHLHTAATSMADKRAVVEDVLKCIAANGGRFLERDNDSSNDSSNDSNDDGDDDCQWHEVSREKAYEKVAMGFRNLRKKRKKTQSKAKMEQNGSDTSNDGHGLTSMMVMVTSTTQ